MLATFLFTVATSDKTRNRLIGSYFLIFALHISVFFYAKYIELPLVIDRLRDQIMFLSSPLLYLYLVSAIYTDFRLSRKHLVHFLPFITVLLIFFPRFYAVGEAERQVFMQTYKLSLEVQVTAVFGVLISLLYLLLMAKELVDYRKVLHTHYSDKTNFNYRWLVQLTCLLGLIFILSHMKQVYFYFGSDEEILNSFRIFLTLFLLSFLTWIVFKSLYQPELFRGVNTSQLRIVGIGNKTALQRTNEQEETAQEGISVPAIELQNWMVTSEPFLDAELSLSELAEQLKITPRELSNLINNQFNVHFFDFINRYRIERAKELLATSSRAEMTVQEIMYASGFNSKSSFYTEFKKHLGQTPAAYRKGLEE